MLPFVTFSLIVSLTKNESKIMKSSKIFWLLIVTLFTWNGLSAQQLKGTVFDSNGEGVPFAKIRVKQTAYGTVANASGVFQLELKAGIHVLEIQALGFQSKLDTLTIGAGQNTVVYHLIEEVRELQTVEFVYQSDRSRGKEVMQKVIEKRPFYQDLSQDYTCDTYCYGTLEKGKMDSIFKDSIVGKEKLNILEWRAKSYVENGTRFKDEFYAFNDFADRYSGGGVGVSVSFEMNEPLAPVGQGIERNPYLFVNGIKEAHFNLLDNTIDAPGLTQNPLISPLAFNAMLYYAFYLEDVFMDSTNKMIYQIRIVPKFDYEALFSGTLFIEDQSWKLRSYELAINPGVLLYFKEMHIAADYVDFGERILPTRKDFVYSIKEGKTKINGLIRVRQSDYSFEKLDKPSKFWLETSSFSDDAFDRDSSYWTVNRPFELTDLEKKFIHTQDSIITYHESDEFKRRNDSIRNRITFISVVFDGIGHTNSFKKYSIWFNPLISQMIPFGVGGYRHRLQVEYTKEFKNGKKLSLNPEADYGFLNRDLKGSMGASFMYNTMNFSKIGFEVGDVYDFVTSNQNIQGAFAPANRVRNKKMQVNYSQELLNGLYLKASVLFSDRKSIDSLKYPSWVNLFGGFQQPQTFDPYRILLTTIDLEYHFRQKYYIRNKRKIVLGSPWPVVNLTYKRGIPSIFAAQANFDFLELQVRDDIKLNSFGTTQWKLRAGTFLFKKDLRVIEHTFFRPSDRWFFSNPVNTLQLLDTALNTSNSYLQFNYIHHFNGFFLNKIWLINRLKLEETVGGSMLFIPDANFAQMEFYAGIERKIRIRKSIFKLGVYAVTQDNTFSKASLNFKVGFNFYNSFTDSWDY